MNKVMAFFKGLAHTTVDYAKEYDGDATVNHAKGELSKPNESRWLEDIWIGSRFLGSGHDEKGEYDTISIYLGGGWFKLISKTY